jgi:hypothetical protein
MMHMVDDWKLIGTFQSFFMVKQKDVMRPLLQLNDAHNE